MCLLSFYSLSNSIWSGLLLGLVMTWMTFDALCVGSWDHFLEFQTKTVSGVRVIFASLYGTFEVGEQES